jgi:hypothetical protein
MRMGIVLRDPLTWIRARTAALVALGLGACAGGGPATDAEDTPSDVGQAVSAVTAAQCGTGYAVEYQSSKLIWCVDTTMWAAHASDIQPFFSYGDAMIKQLETDFGFVLPSYPYFVVVTQPTGGAGTPTPFGPGVFVTGDAFYNELNGLKGFWGYLLTLHEFVNQFTGALNNGGWPTDWWADHRSPFPNSIDWHVLAELGQVTASTIQYPRFSDPTVSSYDPEVPMFDALLTQYGWPALRTTFAAVAADQMDWNGLLDPPSFTQSTVFVSGNPSQLLSDYVIAYLSLGAGADLTSLVTGAGVGQEPPNWNGNPPWAANYTPSSVEVGAIADAHCSLAAASAAVNAAGGGAQVALQQAYANLRKGNYEHASVPGYPGTCGKGCPTECGCDTGRNLCVAQWHGTASNSALPSVVATESVYTQWATGYCANVTVTNRGPAAISSWKVDVNLASATYNGYWNGTFTQDGTDLLVTSTAANGTIQPGQSTSFGFCTSGGAPIQPPSVRTVSGS